MAYIERRQWTNPKGERKTAWRIRYDAPGNDGGMVLKSETFSTRKNAERRLREVVNRIERGEYNDDAMMTVEALLTRWLAAKRDLTESSQRNYQNSLRRLSTGFLARLVGSVTPMDAQAVADTLARSLAAHTVRATMTPLRAAFRQAVRWRMIPFSPFDGILLPHLPRHSGSVLTIPMNPVMHRH